MRYWLIRNPFRHQAWGDVIYWNKFRLYGIRCAFSQKQIATMEIGDKAVFYDRNHRVINGILDVSSEPYTDRTKPESSFKAIDFTPVAQIVPPIPYTALKIHPDFQQCLFFRQPRFTVCEITEEQYRIILQMTTDNRT